MMLNVQIVEMKGSLILYLPIGGIVGLIFLFEILLILDRDLTFLFPGTTTNNISFIEWKDYVHSATNIESLGQLLYTHYFFYFLVSGIILLVAMVGAIVLTLHHRKDVKKQYFEKILKDLPKYEHVFVWMG